VIRAHHGGEALLLQAVLAGAGSLSVGLALFRAELARLVRRRPKSRADGAATNEGDM